MVILEFDIKSQGDKIANMTHLLQKVKSKNVKSEFGDAIA